MNTPSNAGKELPVWYEVSPDRWHLRYLNGVVKAMVRPAIDRGWFWEHWPWMGQWGIAITLEEAKQLAGATWLPCESTRTTPPTQSQEGETVDYSAPTPETDAFMTLIDDSEIDLGQVEAKLKQFECERNAAQREIDRLAGEVAGLKADKERLDWLEENPVHEIGFSEDLRWLKFNSENFLTLRAAIDAARVATEEGKRG